MLGLHVLCLYIFIVSSLVFFFNRIPEGENEWVPTGMGIQMNVSDCCVSSWTSFLLSLSLFFLLFRFAF